ncbi:MAG TPA: MbcA/ParS/Xre antitoxin family protein [Allosphingosinicella sp.]|nr:MbcA/ParS/Xre antitoxin family protein [Allosphingosinicella sp.]
MTRETGKIRYDLLGRRVLAYFTALGYDVLRDVEIGGYSLDFIARKFDPSIGEVTVAVETKAGAAHLGASDISPSLSKFDVLIAQDQITSAMIVTDTGFTAKARQAATAGAAVRLLELDDLEDDLRRESVNEGSIAYRAASPETERGSAVSRLTEQVQTILDESGAPEGFDAPTWLSHWLRQPLPALSGQRPIDLIDTIEGQRLVEQALGQIQSGAYA